MDWSNLQSEHLEWLEREYPNQAWEVPACGMVEEAGELMHAVLKLHQKQVWGEEARHSGLREKLEDAAGDCAIYCMSLCNTLHLDFGQLVNASSTMLGQSSVLATVDVVEAAVRLFRSADRYYSLLAYLGALRGLCQREGLLFESVVQRTWDIVKRRTRTNLGRPGIVCLCGSTRFKEAWYKATKQFTHEGLIVLSVGDLDPNAPGTNVPIDMADSVFILDCDLWFCECCENWCNLDASKRSDCCHGYSSLRPYIGDSTRSKIEYAVKRGKPLRYLSHG